MLSRKSNKFWEEIDYVQNYFRTKLKEITF